MAMATEAIDTRDEKMVSRMSSNIVIDIESEELSFNQAKQIRLQIEKDVEQLRNRVRMLRNEEMRAVKKIDDTRKKTQEFCRQQQQNDQSFLKKQQQDEQQRRYLQHRQNSTMERHNKQAYDVRIRSHEAHHATKKSVSDFRAHNNALK